MVLVLAVGTLSGCLTDDQFLCVSDDQCSSNGVCEPNQYCSFPDDQCDSGRRYGEQAPSGTSNQCVRPEDRIDTEAEPEAEDGSESSGSSTSASSESGSMETGGAALMSVSVSVQNSGGGRVISSPSGIDCGTACSETFSPPPESGIFLDSVPDPGWNFVRWTGDCAGIGTCEVPMQETASVAVAFSQDPVLSVQKVGNGVGAVLSSPDGIDCDEGCESDASPYVEGTAITLTATPSVGTVFIGWTGAGCTGADNCTVTLNTNTTITAEFELETRTLNISKVGPYATSGSTVSEPEGIDCEPMCTSGSTDFDYGTSVTLTSIPYMTSGYEFSGYGGDCTGMSCTLEMTQDRSVEMTFSAE